MKLNIKKIMMTEMGGELEETIKAWDQALEERRKATPGIGDLGKCEKCDIETYDCEFCALSKRDGTNGLYK